MTPQKKAEELVEKNFLILSKRGEHHYTFDYSKQCALLSVDEIMEVCYYTREVENNDLFSYDYWQEVKQEIEKL